MPTYSSPFSIIKKSFQIFFDKTNMIYLLKVYSVPFVLAIVSYLLAYISALLGYASNQYLSGLKSGNAFLIFYVIVWSIIAFIVNIWTMAASYEAVLRVLRGGNLDLKDTYMKAKTKILSLLGINLLVGLIVVLGMILLIVPGIIFGLWYAFAIFYMFDKNYGIIESMKQSKMTTRGHMWKLFGRFLIFAIFSVLVQIVFSFIPNGIGAVVTTLFGGLLILPYGLLYLEFSQVSDNTL